MSAPPTEYSNGHFRCPRLNKSNYLIWANAVKVQMIADRCCRIIDNPPPTPERPAHINGDTPSPASRTGDSNVSIEMILKLTNRDPAPPPP